FTTLFFVNTPGMSLNCIVFKCRHSARSNCFRLKEHNLRQASNHLPGILSIVTHQKKFYEKDNRFRFRLTGIGHHRTSSEERDQKCGYIHGSVLPHTRKIISPAGKSSKS